MDIAVNKLNTYGVRAWSLALFLLVGKQIYAQEKVSGIAAIDEVTVFTNGAEVNSRVPLKMDRGSVMLYIQNVAEGIDLNSVQVSGPEGITILSVSQSRAEEREIFHPEHRKLQDSLEVYTARRDAMLHRQKATQGALNLLNNDKLLGGSTAVSIGDLTRLVDYYQTKVVELNSALDALRKSIIVENKNIDRIKEKMRMYTGSGAQLVLQLYNAKAVQGELGLSYITSAASWKAYYELRSQSITSPLRWLYKAKVVQNTGVDWKKVKLTLSTGTPTRGGTAPELKPSYAQYYIPVKEIPVGSASGINNLQKKAVSPQHTAETAVQQEIISPVANMVVNQLSTTFDIDVPYDILSDGREHSVTLKEFTLPAVYTYYAVPKMDREVYLVAEVSDFEKLNLLRGEANIIFENMFVGTSYIDPAVISDTLKLTMGRDKSIVIKRERIMDEKSSQVSGGSKRQIFTYDIQVRNNKSSPIQLILKDQYPVSTDKSIEINLVDNGGAQVEKERGELLWKVELKPKETKTYRFTYMVKYPKDKVVVFN